LGSLLKFDQLQTACARWPRAGVEREYENREKVHAMDLRRILSLH